MSSALRTTTLIVLTIVLFAVYMFTSASWTPPTATAPNGNTTAPLNVGTSTQSKAGAIAATIFAALTEMRSDRYCDAVGANCLDMVGVGGGGTGAGDQIVYLPAPRAIYTSADFQVSGNINKNYNLPENGYPDNIKRVYLVIEGRAKYDTQTSGENARTIYGDPVIVATRPPFASQPNVLLELPSNGGSGGVRGFQWMGMGGTNSSFGQWVDVRDGSLNLTADCAANCGATGNNAHLNIAIGGYECTGSCGAVLPVRSCQVTFTYNINGKTGTVARTVPGTGDMVVGMYYHKDDWDNPTLPFTYVIDSHAWGGGTFDSSERGKVAFASPSDYRANAAVLNGADGWSNAVIKPMPLTTGSTRTITNEGVSDIGAGAITLTGTVGACVN